MLPTTRSEKAGGSGPGTYDSRMYYVASSGKATEVSIRVPLWRVRRAYTPTGAIHACAEGSHEAACGVPLSMLILWPEHDFSEHDFPHGCPNCAVAMARGEALSAAPAGFRIPGTRRPADDLAGEPNRGR